MSKESVREFYVKVTCMLYEHLKGIFGSDEAVAAFIVRESTDEVMRVLKENGVNKLQLHDLVINTALIKLLKTIKERETGYEDSTV